MMSTSSVPKMYHVGDILYSVEHRGTYYPNIHGLPIRFFKIVKINQVSVTVIELVCVMTEKKFKERNIYKDYYDGRFRPIDVEVTKKSLIGKKKTVARVSEQGVYTSTSGFMCKMRDGEDHVQHTFGESY